VAFAGRCFIEEIPRYIKEKGRSVENSMCFETPRQDNPFFSIVIPIYNAESYIKDTIYSILTQSFADFELLLIDDGSKDHSPAICDEFSKQDCRVHVIHKENEGLVMTTNLGLHLAKGMYIYFVDHDDLLIEGALEKVHAKIKSIHEPPDVLQCNFCFLEKGTIIPSGISFPQKDIPTIEGYRMAYVYENLFCNEQHLIMALWSKFIKTAYVRKNNIIGDPTFFCAVDGDITLKLYTYSSNIVYFDIPIYYWRIGEGLTLSKTQSKEVILARIKWFEKVREHARNIYLTRKARRNIREYADYNLTCQISLLKEHYGDIYEAKHIKTRAAKRMLWAICNPTSKLDLYCRIKSFLELILELIIGRQKTEQFIQKVVTLKKRVFILWK